MINLGFFPDWKQTDTLLFSSDTDTLSLLEPSLTDLSLSRRDEINLHELPFVRAHHGIAVIAQRVSVDAGASRETVPAVFRWARSSEGWAAVLTQIRHLINSGPGHHNYFDGPSDEVVVEFAVGEYNDDWWQRQA